MSKTGRARNVAKAYGRTQFNGNSPREQEAQAFSYVVSALEDSMKNPENQKQYYTAIGFNQKLWTSVKLSMFDPDHEVPEKIRKNILSLGLFIDKHSQKLLAEYDPAELKVLVDINRSMVLGLKGITPEERRAF